MSRRCNVRHAGGGAAVCAVVLAAACSTTGTLPPQAPAMPVPEAFKEDVGGVLTPAQPGSVGDGAPTAAAWWQVFGDAQLDDLQRQLIVGNEDLRSALARLASARATLATSEAALLPTIGVGLTGTRSGQGTGTSSSLTTVTATPTTGTTGGTASNANTAVVSNRSVTNVLSLTASASWEVDLWGRLAQAARSSNAALQASADDVAAARLSAQASLVQLYFSLRSTDAALALLERTEAAYLRSLQVTRNRYAAGVVAQIDVAQAETQWYTAQAQTRDTLATRAQTEHAIAVLLGLPPASLTIARSPTLPSAPATPRLLPATLLQRRPDIAAAERRVAAANAQIGVARAAFFPSLTLSGDAGYRNDTWRHLLSASNLAWSLGPSLALTVFDGGARRAAVEQARATAELSASTYRATVLTALQEVEDNLALADRLREEAALQSQALDAARKTLESTENQYRAGTVSYLNVVTAQVTAFNTERTLIDVNNRQLAATGLLLKNLGGDWRVQ